MGIKAKIIADSIGPAGVRLTTWELTYPRFVHSEVMTHRVFSRNAASSRAIPVKKMMANILKDPALPVFWGANQAGMQASVELAGWRKKAAILTWLVACHFALFFVWVTQKINLHKQIANRISEPWMYITTIVTADQYGVANFFHQRNHPAAQPEFAALAKAMWVLYNTQKPDVLEIDQWHLPFIDFDDRVEATKLAFQEMLAKLQEGDGVSSPDQIIVGSARRREEILLAVSVGRCARVSYLNHNGVRSIEDDIILHDKLKDSQPGHFSPFEHQAQALAIPATIGNFHGWRQYRKILPNEYLPNLPTWDPEVLGV